MMVILVDAGRGPSGNWVQTVDGPTGSELIMAAADTAGAGERERELHRVPVDHGRLAAPAQPPGAADCRPSSAGVAARRPTGIRRDVKLVVTRVGFDQLGPERSGC